MVYIYGIRFAFFLSFDNGYDKPTSYALALYTPLVCSALAGTHTHHITYVAQQQTQSIEMGLAHVNVDAFISKMMENFLLLSFCLVLVKNVGHPVVSWSQTNIVGWWQQVEIER